MHVCTYLLRPYQWFRFTKKANYKTDLLIRMCWLYSTIHGYVRRTNIYKMPAVTWLYRPEWSLLDPSSHVGHSASCVCLQGACCNQRPYIIETMHSYTLPM